MSGGFGKWCCWTLPKTGDFDQNGENGKFAFYTQNNPDNGENDEDGGGCHSGKTMLYRKQGFHNLNHGTFPDLILGSFSRKSVHKPHGHPKTRQDKGKHVDIRIQNFVLLLLISLLFTCSIISWGFVPIVRVPILSRHFGSGQGRKCMVFWCFSLFVIFLSFFWRPKSVVFWCSKWRKRYNPPPCRAPGCNPRRGSFRSFECAATPPAGPCRTPSRTPCSMSQAVWTSETLSRSRGGAATLASVALHFDTKLVLFMVFLGKRKEGQRRT